MLKDVIVVSPQTIKASFPDGDVILDRRLYEQKLGTLVSCSCVDEAIELQKSAQKHLCEIYKVDNLVEPVRC